MTKAKSIKGAPKSAASVAPINKARHMTLVVQGDQTEDRAIAEAALSPEMANASTTADYSTGIFPDICLQDCIEVIQADIKAVNGGNLDKLEGILTAQAEALNAIFNNFAKRAIHANYMPQLETYTRLALKAQGQCRATVEALAEIKYPKSATFIRQQNIAQQQQVNNVIPASVAASSAGIRAREKNITPTNELMEVSHDERLDTGATSAAGSIDSKMATVGTVNGPQNPNRKSNQ